MSNITGYIITGIVSLVVGVILQRLKDRPKLLYWLPGSFIFQLKEPEITLRTDSLTIQNSGRESASSVEIIHQSRPDHFQFSTPVNFVEETTPSGEHVIIIKSLGPKEYVNIQLMSHTNLPVLLNVRAASGPAKQIQVHLQPILSKLVQISAAALMLIGMGLIIYWLVAASIFVYQLAGTTQ